MHEYTSSIQERHLFATGRMYFAYLEQTFFFAGVLTPIPMNWDPVKASGLYGRNLCVSKKHCLHSRTGSSPSCDGNALHATHPPRVGLTRKCRPLFSNTFLSASDKRNTHTWQAILFLWRFGTNALSQI